MTQVITPADFNRTVLEVISSALAGAGMGLPGIPSDDDCYVMWHADAWSEPRPCPDSVVWQRSGGGCYDVTVREDDGRLLAFTEGSTLLDEPFPADVESLGAHLGNLSAGIEAAVCEDFARFELENDGYLPGTEPH